MDEDLRADPLLTTVPEVDGYKVLEPCVLYAKVGQGGMGAVYRGRHVNLGVDVAVKVLDPLRAQQDEQSLARFRREAQLAASIRHENLVRVYDVRQDSGLHYIVMEYVTGETAAERVARKGRLAPREAAAICLGAARGLAAAHALGIVHRDVTPDNILISRDGVVKVADLGLAKPIWSPAHLTATRTMMGTPRYMPPEQWEDSRSVGPPGDVWALGATLYFLLSGEHAIALATLPEVIRQVCAQPFPDIRTAAPDVPDALAAVVERCTSRDARERLPDATELARALEAASGTIGGALTLDDASAGTGTPRAASVSPPPERTLVRAKAAAEAGTLHGPSRGAPRNRRGAAIALAVLLLAAALYLVPGSRGGPADRGPTSPEADPRAAIHRATADNILADPSREPGPPASAPRGGTANTYVVRPLAGLNPLVTARFPLESVVSHVYERLAQRSRVDPERYVPGLANRVVRSADNRVFTIDIRKGMLWHRPHLTPGERDGELGWLAALPPQEITADDVKFTFDAARAGRLLAGHLAGIESVDLLDRYTVAVRWREEGYFNLDSTLSLLRILPRFIWGRAEDGSELTTAEAAARLEDHWFNDRMCGSGPFRFAGAEDRTIRLERWDAYWGVRPAIDAIVARQVSGSDEALRMFKAGALDLLSPSADEYRREFLEGGPGSLRDLLERGEVTVHRQERNTFLCICWNLGHPILRERNVRRALAYAFPKDRVIREAFAGLAVPHDSPVLRYEATYVPDLVEAFPFDPGRAAALLDEAGWLGRDGVRRRTVEGVSADLRIALVTSTGSGILDMAAAYREELARIGVALEVHSLEAAAWSQRVNRRDFDALAIAWYAAHDRSPREVWHSGGSANYGGFADREVDGIIEQLETEFDADERKRLWREFQKRVVAEQPYLFTVSPESAVFVRSRLKAPFLSPGGIWLVPSYIEEPR